jgi:hypothetical protein
VQSLNNNTIIAGIADLKVKGLYTSNGPDLALTEGSAALSGSNFSDADFSSFSKVTFRGAVGPADTWASASTWLSWK